MRRKYHEFMVDLVEPAGPGRLQVFGRCGDYPIRVDDCLDSIFRYRPRKHPEEAGRAPVLDVRKPVALRVVSVHAYQRSLPELGQGMTGSLILEGLGLDDIGPDWILGKKDFNAAITPNAASYTVSDGTLMLTLEPAEEGGYLVTSPLDPQLITQAETLEEAFANAYDASDALMQARAEAWASSVRSPGMVAASSQEKADLVPESARG